MNMRHCSVSGFIVAVTAAVAGCGSEVADPAEDLIEREPEPAAATELASNAGDLYIKEIVSGGRGCSNSGDVSVEISADRKSLSLVFESMRLEYPPGPLVQSISCTLNVMLHLPQGMQMTIASVRTKPYVNVPSGGRARITQTDLLDGNPLPRGPNPDVPGPYDGWAPFTPPMSLAYTLWSRCGAATIAVNLMMNLNMTGAPRGTALVSLASSEGGAKVLHLQWRSCR